MQVLKNLREGNAIEIKSNDSDNTEKKINELIRDDHFLSKITTSNQGRISMTF